jgi:hypothetical protein
VQWSADNVKIVKIEHGIKVRIRKVQAATKPTVSRTVVQMIGSMNQFKSSNKIKIVAENHIEKL